MVSRSPFSVLKEADRCQVIQYISLIPCAAYGTLKLSRNEDGSIRKATCSLCEAIEEADTINLDASRCRNIGVEVVNVFSTLVKSASFLDSRRPRVMAMYALRRFTTHFDDPNFVDLEKSSLGQWCLQSLRSSVRELRIAAGYVFLHQGYLFYANYF